MRLAPAPYSPDAAGKIRERVRAIDVRAEHIVVTPVPAKVSIEGRDVHVPVDQVIVVHAARSLVVGRVVSSALAS